MADIDERLDRAASLWRRARHAVALTGAGISTASGIPDFRSADSGLWDRVDPMVASISGFYREPQRFYDWVRPLARTVLTAEPNPAHYALADLETYGPLQAVVTQNIDMLHTRSGSRTVYEVHGHFRQATCLRCQKVYPGEPLLRAFIDDGRVPRCARDTCQGVLKPNVILFGEMLPAPVFIQAEAASIACDLMLVAGSSLTVTPACDLPLRARNGGARLIIVNREPTPLDYLADVVIQADVVDILPHFAAIFKPG